MGSQRVRHDLETKEQQETVTQGLLYIFSNIPIEVVGLHAHINNIPDYRNLPAMQESWVQFLGREDPLEKEVATHSNILAWRDRKSTRLNSSHIATSRMPSSA